MRGKITHGMCDTTARILGIGVLSHTDFTLMGTYCIPDSRIVQIPSTSLPAFLSSKPPPNLTQAESAITPSGNYLGDKRHVAHEICAGIACSQKAIKTVVAKAHLKYFNHRVMSTIAFVFLSDFSIMSSRQPTSCLTRFATSTSYSFRAADEKARFHGLRCSVCNMGSR